LATLNLTSGAIGRFAILLVLSLGFQELSGKIENIRTKIRLTRLVDMTSVWLFAAAIVLPPAMTFVLVIVLRGHLWFKVNRPANYALYRVTFTAATIWIGCYTAHLTVVAWSHGHGFPVGPLAVLTVLSAIFAYTAINSILVFSAVWLASRPDSSPPFRTIWEDSFIEVATLGLAGLAGLALLFEPWLTILVVPAVAILQRSVLMKELQEAATTDPKTGLLNSLAWHQVASVELERSARDRSSAAVIIVDMDNFKLINDTHGHLAGDAVLKSVAEVLTDELRAYDSVGRFGGEEFVAILPKVDALLALDVSDRILQRIRDLAVPTRNVDVPEITGLSASIGIACFPQQGAEVEDLLHVADAALYTAKREGRDRVEYSYIQ
jgi:diguanylate cyclase (GGDEF)-like protein